MDSFPSFTLPFAPYSGWIDSGNRSFRRSFHYTFVTACARRPSQLAANQQGLSSIQIEAAKRGLDYRQILNDAQQFIEEATEKALLEAWINNLLGVDVQPLMLESGEEEPSSDD